MSNTVRKKHRGVIFGADKEKKWSCQNEIREEIINRNSP